jgi:hypothetical protein
MPKVFNQTPEMIKMKEKLDKHRKVVKELAEYAQNPNSDMFIVVEQEREALKNKEDLYTQMEQEQAQRELVRMKRNSQGNDL